MPLIGKPMLSTMLADPVRRNDRADLLFDLIGQPRRLLDPRSGRRAHVDSDRAGVDRGEEILSEKGSEAERQQGDAEEAAGKPRAMLQRQLQQADVALPQPLETMFEPALKAREKAHSAGVSASAAQSNDVLVAQQKVRHRRHQRVGQQIGGDHREHHRHRERPEQIAGDAAERKQRHEGDADAEQRDRRRAA